MTPIERLLSVEEPLDPRHRRTHRPGRLTQPNPAAADGTNRRLLPPPPARLRSYSRIRSTVPYPTDGGDLHVGVGKDTFLKS
jgi:hypothetical protein